MNIQNNGCMEVNIGKSNIVKKINSVEILFYNGEVLETIDSFLYLRFIFYS